MLKQMHLITETEGGPEFNICADEANSDWLRAYRLSQSKNKKDQEELERRFNTHMYQDKN